jgi:hypothetical protein
MGQKQVSKYQEASEQALIQTTIRLTWPPLRRLAEISRISVRRLLNRNLHLNVRVHVRRDFPIQQTAVLRFRICLVVEFVIALRPLPLVTKGLGQTTAESLQATGRLLADMAGFDLGDVARFVVGRLRA